MKQRNNLGCRFTSWIALFFEKDSTNVTSRIFTWMNKNRDSRFLAERNAHFHLQRSGTKHKYVLTKILKKVFFYYFRLTTFLQKKVFSNWFCWKKKIERKHERRNTCMHCCTLHTKNIEFHLLYFPPFFFRKE